MEPFDDICQILNVGKSYPRCMVAILAHSISPPSVFSLYRLFPVRHFRLAMYGCHVLMICLALVSNLVVLLQCKRCLSVE